MKLDALKKISAMLDGIPEYRGCPAEIVNRKRIAIAAVELFLKKQNEAAWNYMMERVDLYRSSVEAWEKTPEFLRARIKEVFSW